MNPHHTNTIGRIKSSCKHTSLRCNVTQINNTFRALLAIHRFICKIALHSVFALQMEYFLPIVKETSFFTNDLHKRLFLSCPASILQQHKSNFHRTRIWVPFVIRTHKALDKRRETLFLLSSSVYVFLVLSFFLLFISLGIYIHIFQETLLRFSFTNSILFVYSSTTNFLSRFSA